MLTSCFSFLVILCILVYFYLMLDLHLKNKGIYSPIRHAVSDYGVGEYKYLFNWAGIVSTFRNIFLIGALICWNYEASFKEKAIWLLVLALVGYFGVMVFPTDIEGSHKTISGRLHLLFAILQFTVLAIFLFQLTDVMSALVPSLAVFFLAIEWLIKIGLYGLVAALILPFLKPFFGLLERIFLYASNIYILIFCIILFQQK